MFSEFEILGTIDALANLLHQETTLLKQHQNQEALKLLEMKELLTLQYHQVQESLKKMDTPSPGFVETLRTKYNRLIEKARESKEVLEVVMSANSRILNDVVDRLNERNRPTMMYGANARARNLNKSMPPSMALNERL